MRYLLLVLISLVLASCGATKEIEKSHHSEYNSVLRLDSIINASLKRDSIYIRDSVYLREKGDTIYHYAERVVYKYVDRYDTIYRQTFVTDTAYVERVDTITQVRKVYAEKPERWYNKIFIHFGRLCLLALILWAVFLYRKRRF